MMTDFPSLSATLRPDAAATDDNISNILNPLPSQSASSSKFQLNQGMYLTNIQQDLQNELSYERVLSSDRAGSPPIVVSPSTGQSTPNAEPVSSQTMVAARPPASSTSRSPADNPKALEEENKIKKEMMMGVFPLNSKKRGRGKSPTRAPDAPGESDASRKSTQPKCKKKKVSASDPNAVSENQEDASKKMNGTAQPIERLLGPVQLGDGRPLVGAHSQSTMQTDDRSRIAMLEDKISWLQHEAAHRLDVITVNHQRDAYEACRAMLELTCEKVSLQREIVKLQHSVDRLRDIVAVRDRKIAGLEMELSTWRPVRTRRQA